ncbi:MAG: DUF2066 domain-containing protein [Pseudomonadota bacterium]|nr:DUF2066 domain-containing protein [Pseudomonadota bacterium]
MRAVFLVVFWCLSMASHAVMVSDLYRVRVPVADQTAESRETGIRQALQQVVVKVSGQSVSAQNEVVQQAAGSADRYVKSFRFSRDDDEAGLQLDVLFAQNLIDKLLRDAALPVWGKSRPLVLLWQGVEDERQRLLVNTANPQWQVRLERAMNERGIPLLWPALDLEDDAALPLGRLWGLFRGDVATASQRYAADAVVAGRLSQDRQGAWQYSGFLSHKEEMLDLQAVNDDLAVVLRQVADQVAGFLSLRYAVVNDGSAGGHELRVQDVQNFRQYHDLLTYLNANVAINSVRVAAASEHELTLELDLAADWAQVWSTLELDRKLLGTGQDSVYRWRQ